MTYEQEYISQSDVENALRQAGLKFKRGSRYITSQCPLHQDRNASAQIFYDDWFVSCMASCGRYHITKAFPHLSNNKSGLDKRSWNGNSRTPQKSKPVSEHYQEFDLYEDWLKMPLIPRTHTFKTIPLDILDEMGWRWVPERDAYFIPYWNASKTKIPFAQYRNLNSSVRFNFLKDAKPTLLGKWNLSPGEKIVLVEGASDGAALDYCAIPWIAAPSASSGTLVKALMQWCGENNVTLIYGSDNDEAGDSLLKVVEESGVPYRVLQPPKQYKDYAAFLEACGVDTVSSYVAKEFGFKSETGIGYVQRVFPGAEELKVT